MSVTVRRSASQVDTWNAIPGETRWIDYTHLEAGEDLIVFVHTYRRVRERLDSTRDARLWKPSTTKVAHRYAAGEWDEVLDVEHGAPPVEVEYVALSERRAPVRSSARRSRR